MSEPSTSIPTEALGGRTCATCACFFAQINPLNPQQLQGFCRRTVAKPYQARVQQPQVLNGEPRIDKRTGQPILETVQVHGMMYDLTDAHGSCFDGWRPLGTLPGERAAEAMLRIALPRLLQNPDMPEELRQVIQAAMTALSGPEPKTLAS